MALKFDLVSPERLLFSGDVRQVVVPGMDGEFTVLENHAPLVSTLKPGVVTVTGADGKSERIFVGGGFAEVNPKGLTILAEEAMPVAELSPEKIARDIKDAEEDLADAKDDASRQRAHQLIGHLKELQSAVR
ncbi:MAG: F0F1 ATP synthase subunit epsilon [Hyphomicrobiales bacterium]